MGGFDVVHVRIESCPYPCCGFRDLPEFMAQHMADEHAPEGPMSWNDWRDFYLNVQGLDEKQAEEEAERRIVEQENRALLRAREPGGL